MSTTVLSFGRGPVKWRLPGLVVLMVIILLAFGGMHVINATKSSIMETTVLTSSAQGWELSSSATAGYATMLQFTIMCTPGNDGGPDKYDIFGRALFDRFQSSFNFSGSKPPGCLPDLEDPDVFEALRDAIVKSLGGEENVSLPVKLFAKTIVETLKLNLPFLGF